MDTDGEGRQKRLTVTHSASPASIISIPSAACMSTQGLLHVSTREHMQIRAKQAMLLIISKDWETSTVIPHLFGTRDQFRGRQFFHESGHGEGMVSWWFKHIAFIVHSISIIITSAPPQVTRLQILEVGTPALKDVFAGVPTVLMEPQAELKWRKCITLLEKWRNRYFLYKSCLFKKSRWGQMFRNRRWREVYQEFPCGWFSVYTSLTPVGLSCWLSELCYLSGHWHGIFKKKVQVNWSKRKGCFGIHLPWGEWQHSRKESILFKSGM